MEFKPITIEITDVNKPPIIRVDGVRVPVVEFEHIYNTRTAHHNGTHRYHLKYIEDNRVKVIGSERATPCKACGRYDLEITNFIANEKVHYSTVKCMSCGHEENESFG